MTKVCGGWVSIPHRLRLVVWCVFLLLAGKQGGAIGRCIIFIYIDDFHDHDSFCL